MRIVTLTVSAMLLVTTAMAFDGDRDQAVRNDRKAFEQNANWIYNDLAKGFAAARASGKPMLVVFR